jgi:hypothetical protein
MAILQFKKAIESSHFWLPLYAAVIFLIIPNLQITLLLIMLSLALSLHRLVRSDIPFEIESNTVTALYVSYTFSWLTGFAVGSMLVCFSLIIGKRYDYKNLIKFFALAFVCMLAGKIQAELFIWLAFLIVTYNLILITIYNFLGLNIIKNITFQGSSIVVNILVLSIFF